MRETADIVPLSTADRQAARGDRKVAETVHKPADIEARKSSNGHPVVVPNTRGRVPVDPKDPEVNIRKGRSRVTNGAAFVLGTDQRNPWIRRCKDITAAHISDLDLGDGISEAQRSLIRRIAVLTTQLEMLESKFAAANGEASAKDLDLYVRSSGVLRRSLQTIGLERRAPRPIPSMSEFLRSLPPQQPTHADAVELLDD